MFPPHAESGSGAPHRAALAVVLAFGFADAWRGDSHPASNAPCPAHTKQVREAGVSPRSLGRLVLRLLDPLQQDSDAPSTRTPI